MLARHPATARHIAHKLAVHFVADDPDPALVTGLETAWRAVRQRDLAAMGADDAVERREIAAMPVGRGRADAPQFRRLELVALDEALA